MFLNITNRPTVQPTTPIEGAPGHELAWPYEVAYPIHLLLDLEARTTWHKTEADALAAVARWEQRHERARIDAQDATVARLVDCGPARGRRLFAGQPARSI